MIIRSETKADIDAIRSLNQAAFDTGAESLLVDRLRESADPFVSLVADRNGEVVGNIVFSPVTINDDTQIRILGLAPMAVAPAHQRQGVGSALVSAGLEACRDLDAAALVVLGHPGFYPRFGFVPASRFGIGCEYDVPDDTFMAMELDAGCLQLAGGTIRYNPAFAEV